MDKKIIIPCLPHEDLTKILAMLCLNIQNEYDISSQVIQEVINKDTFIVDCQFLYEQYETEMVNNLNSFKENYDTDNIVITPEEYEKCGHLINTHQNTYVTYCNAHKYLHPHPTMGDCKYDYDIPHPFAVKSDQQIIKERYHNTIHVIYQSFINKAYHLIWKLFNFLILDASTSHILTTDDENLKHVIDEMTYNPKLFKSRRIYEFINTDEVHPTKTYYVKIYKLA
jgi:hypothetical protein